jgi:hypothetical protein
MIQPARTQEPLPKLIFLRYVVDKTTIRSGSENPQRLERASSLRRKQEVLLNTIEAVLALIADDHDMLWEDSCTSLSTISTQ